MSVADSPLHEYLTRDDLARDLGKSVRTLDRWEALRIGPPRTKVGRSVLYRKAALAVWLREREQPGDGGKKAFWQGIRSF